MLTGCVHSDSKSLSDTQNIQDKKNLTLTAKVTGKPEPEVKWYRDSTEIQPTFKIKMTKAEETCTLTVTGVTLKMSANYKCVATNRAGEATHVAKITVQGECAAIWLLIMQGDMPAFHFKIFKLDYKATLA